MGEVELDDRVLVLRRIKVTYHLEGVADDQRDTVARVLGFHADKCPVARSVRDAIDIATDLEYV